MKPWILWMSVAAAACVVPADDKATVDTDATDLPLPADADNDGYRADVDCDDANPLVNPGRKEVCNGADDNCDGDRDQSDSPIDDPAAMGPLFLDADVDGFGDRTTGRYYCGSPNEVRIEKGGDCDDTNPNVRPGVPEICDDIDNDCDDLVDGADGDLDIQGSPNAVQRYTDADGDGVGVGTLMWSCDGEEPGFADQSGDCDDGDPNRFPGNPEVCDGVDNDCDNDVDADDADVAASDVGTYYLDADNDGFGHEGSAGTKVCLSLAPSGAVFNDDDCNDSDANIRPTASEVCDGVDNDCDDDVDLDDASLDSSTTTTLWRDSDNDGYGDPAQSQAFCTAPSSGWATNLDDCAPSDRNRHPGATEICNSLDDDCNQDVDDDDAGVVVSIAWYIDGDGDGYPDPSNAQLVCTQPASGYRLTASNGDCVDTNAAVHPGAPETYYDGVDQDCDGGDDWDADGDGYRDPSAPGGGDDCDDTRASVNLGGSEVPYDGLDNDCVDGDECDVDGDLQLASQCGGDDCRDNDSSVGLGFAEVCDGKDNDCDDDVDADDEDIETGELVAAWRDLDGDDFGDPAAPVSTCAGAPGTVDNDEDCDDTREAVNPDATEVCNGLDDNCRNGIDDADPQVQASEGWYVDGDRDGHPVNGPQVMTCDSPGEGFARLTLGFDCDDNNADAFPGSSPNEAAPTRCFLDADGDDYGDKFAAPPIFAGTDCDDSTELRNPGVVEVWYDGLDGDCSGDDDFDQDGDGFLSDAHGGTDCEDTVFEVNPDATEIFDNGFDDDCDGVAECDSDGDGLCDSDEIAFGSDPQRIDSDDDGYFDGDELLNGTDPNDASDPGHPFDGGIIDIEGHRYGLCVEYSDGRFECRGETARGFGDRPQVLAGPTARLGVPLRYLTPPDFANDWLYLRPDGRMVRYSPVHGEVIDWTTAPTPLSKDYRTTRHGACFLGDDDVWRCTVSHQSDGYPADFVGVEALDDVRMGSHSYSGTSLCGRLEDGKLACWSRWVTADALVDDLPDVLFTEYQISRDYGCGLNELGEILCWGNNTDGLGVLEAPAGTGFTGLEVGRSASCALDSAGLPVCWGDSDLVDRTPYHEAMTKLTFVDRSGQATACGLTVDGAVRCWGYLRQYFQLYTTPKDGAGPGESECSLTPLGDPVCWYDSSTDHPVTGPGVEPMGPFLQVSVIPSALACGIDAGAGLNCWGFPDAYLLNNLPTSGGWQEVHLRTNYLAITLDTTGTFEPLGIVPTGSVFEAEVLDLPTTSGWRDYRHERTSACAIRADGDVVCWGDRSDVIGPNVLTYDIHTEGGFKGCAVLGDQTGTCWGVGNVVIAAKPPANETFIDVVVAEEGAWWRRTTGEWIWRGFGTIWATYPEGVDITPSRGGFGNGDAGYDADGQFYAWYNNFRQPLRNVVRDYDHDAILDSDELMYGTDPRNADSDGDGLTDGREILVEGTNPREVDSDEDGVNDGDEVAAGTDPLVP